MTPVQLKAYDFIRDMIAEVGCPPTYDEIAAELQLRSKGNVARIVELLVQQGKLVRTSAHVRSLALPNMPDLAAVPTSALRAEMARRGETLDALAKPRTLTGSGICAANGCRDNVRPGMLFCRHHYFLLSPARQHELKRKWALGDQPAFQAALDAAREYLDMRAAS